MKPPEDLLKSDGGPLVADNSEINVLFIHSCVDEMHLSLGAFRVLCHLKRRADQTGKSFPGMRSIAAMCDTSIFTVHKSIQELQKRGMISVIARGENVSNAYVLTSPKHWKNKDGSQLSPEQCPKARAVIQDNTPVITDNTPVSVYNSAVIQANSAVIQDNESISKEVYPLKEGGSSNGSCRTGSSRRKGTSLTDEEFLSELKRDPGYQGIDIDAEAARARRWCEVNQKVLTRKRFVDWLNRAAERSKPLVTVNGDSNGAPAQKSLTKGGVFDL